MQPDQQNQPNTSPSPSIPESEPVSFIQHVESAAQTPVVSLSEVSDTMSAAQAPSINTTSQGGEPVYWQATEYIHHEKNNIWFVVFGIVVLAFMAFAIFVIGSITFAILIPVMAASLLVYTHRPPRILDYTLSSKGLYVNDKLYPIGEYKSFGIIRDMDEYSIMLIPVKRFRPGVTVYFPEEAGEAIVDMLGSRMPMQDLHLDAVDRLIRKLRI